MTGVDLEYVLAFNAGSSSLKFELFASRPTWRSCLRGAVRDIGRRNSLLNVEGREPEPEAPVADSSHAAELILDRLMGRGMGDFSPAQIVATGHRVVHGGSLFSAPVLVTQSVADRLQGLSELAPLHNVPALDVIAVVRDRLKDTPVAAVFDTAFFHELPEAARAYAVPAKWRASGEIRRYGFHGIAHEYLARRLAARRGKLPGRVLSLQLGQGCSIAALREGAPVETSMGFTPLEGLIMATRPGDLDAGVILQMARQGESWRAIDDALNRESGLLGLSGVTDDMRELIALEGQGHPGATLALASYCHRIHKYLGAYAAVLGGVDAVVFGGGIGENAPVIRERICKGLEWLGLALDAAANARCLGAQALISTDSSAIEVHVIPVNEEEAIGRAAFALSQGRKRSHGS